MGRAAASYLDAIERPLLMALKWMRIERMHSWVIRQAAIVMLGLCVTLLLAEESSAGDSQIFRPEKRNVPLPSGSDPSVIAGSTIVRRAALASDAVYEDNSKAKKAGLIPLTKYDSMTGNVKAYRDTLTGKYFVVVRGTDNLDDLVQADPEFSGAPTINPTLERRVREASAVVSALSKDLSGTPFSAWDQIVVTGHSLGGGVANVVGQASQYTTVTFNAPPTNLAIEKRGLLRAAQEELGTMTLNRQGVNSDNILNVRVTGDPVSALPFKGGTAGRVVALMSPNASSLANHDELLDIILKPHLMRSVLAALDWHERAALNAFVRHEDVFGDGLSATLGQESASGAGRSVVRTEASGGGSNADLSLLEMPESSGRARMSEMKQRYRANQEEQRRAQEEAIQEAQRQQQQSEVSASARNGGGFSDLLKGMTEGINAWTEYQGAVQRAADQLKSPSTYVDPCPPCVPRPGSVCTCQ